MAESTEKRQQNLSLLESQRQAFSKSEWDETVALYKKLEKLGKQPTAIRVETACLAARALAALKNRSTARTMLQTVANREYSKPAHYEFLVRAYLDLKNYDEAARFAGLAAKLQKIERASQQPATHKPPLRIALSGAGLN